MSPRTTTDWEAETYDRLAAPQEAWAREVLERLPLEGDETVLDAGCGSGRVTRLLLDRLPAGRVIGVDGSPSMIANARSSLASEVEAGRLALINSDLLELSPRMLAEEAGGGGVDAVFSNATFHWIADHERLFERLFSVIRPGGRMVAQCGGRGNVQTWIEAIERVSAREPFAEHVEGFAPWNFYGPEETAGRLRAAGFTDVETSLERKHVEPDDAKLFVSAVGLASLHERLPAELRDRYSDAVTGELPDPLQLDYVRLNLDGSRSDG